ncbi:DUF4232 domain-containing protein [Streptomyces roseochromogenus]|uniref:DUF4232 domain-containing protein n=1 Tax=Streptomyces roseochromogenus subsp. oscitans DS 12.976 TaxID=1352936 RepID=V6JN42_STRRC|nr:DUF4232 domain-containing protein [Streptomyces roseochromogenus]EST21307.1 hypothetical protein M878_37435 [Streptomyces roseochromogenus subsp. oscitans DS 12.976]
MRVQKLSLLAIAAVAGLSLTACNSGDKDSSDASGSSTPSQSAASQDSGSSSQGSGSSSTGGGVSSGKGTGTGTGTGQSGTSGSGACKTAQLAFSTSGGMAEGELIVNLKNTGSTACTLKGFPGVDLKSKDGSLSAKRSKLAAAPVSVKPGAETRFTLHYPPNHSGGTGETFTSLVVTPPNETHSHTLPVGINVPVSDGSGPAITVDPVGTGK